MSDRLEIVPTEWYVAEVRALPNDERTRIDRRLAGFVEKGWAAAMRDGTVKHLRDGIHEVRVLGKGAAYRVLFFLVPGRSPRVVVLTTCASKSSVAKRQRLEAEITRASDRRATWMEQETQRGRNER